MAVSDVAVVLSAVISVAVLGWFFFALAWAAWAAWAAQLQGGVQWVEVRVAGGYGPATR